MDRRKLSLLFAATLALAPFPLPRGAAPAQDPAEPPGSKPASKLLASPAGVMALKSVDKASLRATIDELVGCGTRSSLSSWTDPKRGIGCARDRIVARFNQIAQNSSGRLEVTVDKFDATSPSPTLTTGVRFRRFSTIFSR